MASRPPGRPAQKGGSGGRKTCFNCGSPNHLASQCPNRGATPPSQPRPSGRGQAQGAVRQSGPPTTGQITSLPSRGLARPDLNVPPRSVQTTPSATQNPPPPPGMHQGLITKPDPSITAAEDALVKVTRDQMFKDHPGRRGYGSQGKRIQLFANYFKLNTPFDSSASGLVKTTWYRYTVQVLVGRTLSKHARRRLMTEILQDGHFAGKVFATDFSNNIILTEKLELANNAWQGEIVLPPLNGNVPIAVTQNTQQGQVPAFVQEARTRNTIKFLLSYDAAFSLEAMMQYLTSPSRAASYEGSDVIISLLNIILCMAPQQHSLITNVGQNKFYAYDSHPLRDTHFLGGGLSAHRGYFISVRSAVNRLLVNMNTTSGAFYNNVPVEILLSQAKLGYNPAGEAFLSLLKIDVDYGNGKTRTKSIVGFARAPRFGGANSVTFIYTDPSGQQRPTTVQRYFQQAHSINLVKPSLPVLNVGTSRKPQYVPMELCTVKSGQPYRRLLAGDQTSEMIKFAARAPNQNAHDIAGTANAPGAGLRMFGLAACSDQSDPQLASVKPWGFSVDTQMLVVPARVLSAPRVSYLKSPMTPRFGSWNCEKQKFVAGGTIGKWKTLLINCPESRKKALIGDDSEKLLINLENAIKSYGINIGEYVSTETIDLSTLTTNNRAANDALLDKAFQRAQKQEVHMLFIVLFDADKWLYSRIKIFGDVKYGIHTVNTIGSKVQRSKNQGMFFGNLALKFNIKGGGVCHTVENTLVKPLDKDTMLVGIDVTHPSPGSSENAPSIAAVVASMDHQLSQWPGSIRTQAGKQEMVQGLKEMVLERLDLWRKKHNKLPTKIVVYRDGVSEGQYELVLQNEVPPFEEAFKERYAGQQWPKMSVIIVGKRHHTRFYPTKVEDADCNAQLNKGSWNPQPGTVVDRHIVHRTRREFWLQAHQGLQGTARPAHYVVIKDDIKFEADEMEAITHKLCYLFNRATKAVSICPPAYYADLLCERGRSYLYGVLAENHRSDSSAFNAANAEWTSGVHNNLKDTTWYI